LKKVVVIGGDGIGPEVISSAMNVMEALSVPIEFIPADMGQSCFRKCGTYLPSTTVELLEEADACLFGAITSSQDPSYKSPLLFLRKHFDLFVNIRPVRRLCPDLGLVDLDVVIFRENTEGMYTGVEREEGEAVILERRVSEGTCRRLIRFALDYSLREGRRRITCVHKANVLKKSDGLFRRVFFEEGDALPLEKREMLVDAAAAALVSKPAEMDSIVTLNLYGDILSDEASALTGGLGFAPSVNMGERMAIFEPVHGSAPDIQGKDAANPVGAMLSAVMMLRYLGLVEDAAVMEEAIVSTLSEGLRTPDAGGTCGTRRFTEEVISHLP